MTTGAADGYIKPPGGWTSTTENAVLIDPIGKTGDGFGSAVSASGQVAVAATPGAGRAYAFQYVSNSGFTNFTAPGPNVSATNLNGLNNLGEVVGTVQSNDCGQGCGFLLNNGVFTAINYPGAIGTKATGINDSGEIVGVYSTSVTSQGFTETGGVYASVNYPGATGTSVLGVNNAGDLVGAYSGADGFGHAFLYSNGVFTTIEPVGATGSEAIGINNSGQITGQSCISTCESFLYSDGVFSVVTYPKAAYTYVRGLNDNGDLVGNWLNQSGQLQDFVYWNSNHHFESFNIGDGEWSIASGINNDGEIVGFFTPFNGTYGFYGHLPGH